MAQGTLLPNHAEVEAPLSSSEGRRHPDGGPRLSGPCTLPCLWNPIRSSAQPITDLLLHGGGFSAIVLDMGSIAPSFATCVPLATWFRYRAAAERSQASILLLSQHACAKSSAELVLQMESEDARCDEETVFTGLHHRVLVQRQRFTNHRTSCR